MPTTPDRPVSGAGRPAGSEDVLAAAEAEHLAARDTVPVDVRPRRPADRDTVALDPGSRPLDTDDQPFDAGSATLEPVRKPAAAAPATVRLPRQRIRDRRGEGRAPLVVAVAFAAIWAALLSYLPVAVVVGFARSMEGAGGIAGSAKVALAAWLLGHAVPLGTSIGPVTLTPLLLTLLACWRLIRAGVHVTRAIGASRSGSPRAACVVAVSVGVGYGALGALAAALVNAPGAEVSVPRAAVTFTVVGLLGAFIGALRSTGAIVVLARRVPAPVRHGLRTGLIAALFVLAAGAGFTGLSVAISGGQAAEMIGAYRTGAAGQGGITLVSLGYGVNAAIWAVAYLLGPGFLLGTATTVRLTEVTVGPLPTVPLLAGLPDGPAGATGAALLAVPVLAGMCAGWLLTRRLMRSRELPAAPTKTGVTPAGSGTPRWSLVLGSAAISGPAAGLLLGLLGWLSAGSLGADRLARIGPVPWMMGLVAAAVITVSAVLGAAAARSFRSPPGR